MLYLQKLEFKVSIILVILNFFTSAHAQEVHQQNINTSIKGATVFLSGAEVHRRAEVKLKKGINQLRFINISTTADSRSIQFETVEDIDLRSITMERDFLSLTERNDDIKSLKDSIEFYEFKNQDVQDERKALEVEKEMLSKNQKIGGQNVNLTVSEIRDAADFYRTRTAEINKSLTLYSREINSINNKLVKLRRQLSENNYKEHVKDNVIVVLLEVDEPRTVNAKLSYNVSNCGWAPSYDLIAEDVSGEIELKYKAKVFNNTGNDWEDIDIKLSTGDPNLSASFPELTPWHLNSSSFSTVQKGKNNRYSVPQMQSRADKYQQSNDQGILDGEGRLNTTTGNFSGEAAPAVTMRSIEVSELSTEFEIDRKYSIPSDSRPYIVEITVYKLDAVFSHISVPKSDKDAFLLAKIAGWQKLDLVPGPSQVYFSQTYVGESYINTRNVEDTLGLSFGRDKKVLVTRKKVEEYSNKRVIGNWKRDLYSYEIIVKNNRNRNISMEVKDQVPVSQDSDISISVEETSNAKYDEAEGLLTWNVDLEPGESVKYTFTFEIKYPKNKNVNIKRYRTISAPSF